MGAQAREFSPTELRRMKQMVESGVTRKAIGLSFGCGDAKITREVRKQGWKAPVRLWGREKAKKAPAPIFDFGVRHVAVTHDGRPLGFTEPLEPDNPHRKRQNQIDALRRGKKNAPRGPKYRTPPQIVVKILQDGRSHRTIARAYGVPPSTVGDIKRQAVAV